MKITHVLSDGTELDDIQGHVVKVGDAKSVYNLIDSINKNGKRGENGKKENEKSKT